MCLPLHFRALLAPVCRVHCRLRAEGKIEKLTRSLARGDDSSAEG